MVTLPPSKRALTSCTENADSVKPSLPAACSSGGICAIGGVDPKQPEDFEEMVDELEEETGSTEVFSVGLYDGYAVVYAPVDNTDATIAYRWDGGGIEEWTKSTSSDAPASDALTSGPRTGTPWRRASRTSECGE